MAAPTKGSDVPESQRQALASASDAASQAAKGLNVLVLREGAHDFFWKAKIQELEAEELALDIHHIFPQDWCEKNGIKRAVYNTIVNKTPISYKANRMIGGHAPSKYLNKLQEHKQVQLDNAAMDVILTSHLIPPGAIRADDFHAFYASRKAALIALIERAMAKGVAGAVPSDSVNEGAFEDDESDVPQIV